MRIPNHNHLTKRRDGFARERKKSASRVPILVAGLTLDPMSALRISRPSRERHLTRIPPILTHNATARPSVQLDGIPAIYIVPVLCC